MTQNCLGKIRSHYARFSEKEKKIANYILEQPEQIIHSTINEVADDLNVADATVFRFCKRIGFKGYQAMKIALAAEIMTPIQQIHEEISETDNEKTIAEKIFRSNVRTLENTLQILEGNAIEKAVKLLMKADKVQFYGTGGSSVVAMDAFHKFVRTGIKTFAFIDSHFQLMSASQLTKQDVAVVISHSGTNKDTMNILNTAKANGAKTIGITGFPKSPLSQNVDVSLYTSSEETEYRSEALASRIGQLSLIDALYVNVMIANKDTSKHSLEKVRDAIAETRI
ncbi:MULTISPECIES: MurR/RpiR family transcriptional regulator [Priestia]|jgi:RpiR family transcriptional regulator, carbohydrate utilization regulator|uniref:MurR/RpiR family transcriptional regulator n=1 Tax=Priestia TaxID=2800373 RepID=UPI000BF7DD87|nr:MULTISPECIES: MurR/RpiR family transcriptional regulator [Priestia]MBK0006830.1 MurR/RpiR family transcriptional regulator [Bacillus sp. S35]MEB4857545.1 MurR/RpiR family transcriptional regulator [Priestia megaterium]PFW80376.1 RpiR family transcriptional regulator [Priestia aryabhattai]UYP07003.1 MurR/RpiR family transcriptional regulator [Priestia megaterium]